MALKIIGMVDQRHSEDQVIEKKNTWREEMWNIEVSLSKYIL